MACLKGLSDQFVLALIHRRAFEDSPACLKVAFERETVPGRKQILNGEIASFFLPRITVADKNTKILNIPPEINITMKKIQNI